MPSRGPLFLSLQVARPFDIEAKPFEEELAAAAVCDDRDPDQAKPLVKEFSDLSLFDDFADLNECPSAMEVVAAALDVKLPGRHNKLRALVSQDASRFVPHLPPGLSIMEQPTLANKMPQVAEQAVEQARPKGEKQAPAKGPAAAMEHASPTEVEHAVRTFHSKMYSTGNKVATSIRNEFTCLGADVRFEAVSEGVSLCTVSITVSVEHHAKVVRAIVGHAMERLRSIEAKCRGLCLIGKRGTPFIVGPFGFTATFGSGPPKSDMCRDMYEHGSCRFGPRCRYRHPISMIHFEFIVLLHA